MGTSQNRMFQLSKGYLSCLSSGKVPRENAWKGGSGCQKPKQKKLKGSACLVQNQLIRFTTSGTSW